MNVNAHDFFTKTRPSRLFLAAAVPGSVGMLASSLYGLTDAVLVGRFLGAAAFAAQNLAFPFVVINFALADLVGVGSAVPISISLGRGEDDEADNIFSCACAMIIAAGAAVGAVLYATAPALIGIMGAEGEFARFAVEYLRVYALCSPLTTIVFAVDNYLRVCGYVRSSMWLNIFMSLLICAMEFFFLAVCGFGIWGAALGTCLGMMLCAVVALLPFAMGKMRLRFRRPRFSFAMTRRIIAAGAPNFLNNIAGRVTSILMNALLIRLGGADAVSIYGVLMTLDFIVLSLYYGMCDALQPAVGYNWGAGRYSRVKSIEKLCFSASAAVSVVSAVVIFLFPAQITALIIPSADATFVETSVFALRIFCVAYLARWFSFASQSYMLAVEHPAGATAISVSTALVFPALLMVILQPLGLTGLWFNFPGTSLLAALLSLEVLRRFKKELRAAALQRLLQRPARH